MDVALIYGLTSSRSEEVRYIGQTKVSANRRLQEHLWASLRGGKSALYKWIRRERDCGYSISIIPFCIGRRNVDEEFYIARARAIGWRLLNLTNGGDGGSTMHGRTHSPETREKMRESSKGKNSGAIRSLEFRQKVSETMKRKIAESQSWKERLSKISIDRHKNDLITRLGNTNQPKEK